MATLVQGFRLADREVIAFVGAGGKTTGMFRLARELAAHGASAIVTTTTKILVPPESDDLALVVERDPATLRSKVTRALERGRIPVVAHATTGDGKLEGVTPEVVAHLAGLPAARYVLVEADGAARKPFKAPREGEPVIPPVTTIVVAVVGIDALGEPLGRIAHRPERVMELTGLAAGDRLDAAAIASVVMDPRGGAKDVPAHARFVVLINKADDAGSLERARELARAVLARGASHIVIAALEAEDPVREMSAV